LDGLLCGGIKRKAGEDEVIVTAPMGGAQGVIHLKTSDAAKFGADDHGHAVRLAVLGLELAIGVQKTALDGIELGEGDVLVAGESEAVVLE
jgi:hypothetical protein